MMFIDFYDDVELVTGSKYLNTFQDQNCTFFIYQMNKAKASKNEDEQQNKMKSRTMNKRPKIMNNEAQINK
jgi:hypothetical protein